MPYPGEIAAWGRCCCPAPCMCIPNVRNWGYYVRHWSPWPGDEAREDIRFPDARGLETLPTPEGTKPEPLPKEEYAEPEEGPGIEIQEGPPTGPIETPVPFPLGPGFRGGLPGLDLEPEGPSPQQPSIKGTPPQGTTPEPESTKKPSTDSAPPAPLPDQSGTLPNAPGPLPSVAGPTPPKLAADRAGELLDETDPPLLQVPTGELSVPIAPLPSESDTPPAPERPSLVMGKTPVRPAVPTVDNQTQKPPTSEARQTTLLEKGTSPARAAKNTTPKTKPPAPAEARPRGAASSRSAARSQSKPPVWRSRRGRTQPSAARPVDYKQPAGIAPVGLDGYCPVELVRHEQWVEGNAHLAVEYEGRTYLMSGPLQHRLFQADPERYAPALSGCDPVLVATGAGRHAGRADACVMYQGRLFMFSSQATLVQFRQNPKRFTTGSARPAK